MEAGFQHAFSAAIRAYRRGSTPIGCAVVDGDNRILSTGEDPLSVDQIPLGPGDFTSFVVADLEAYRRFVEAYSVRKNLTIPSWLAEKADAANINYSQVLQESLMARLG